MADTAYTRWSVLGAGEAGCRIAADYVTKHPNIAIGDRIVLLNSAQADLTNLLRSVEADVGIEDAQARMKLLTQNQILVGNTAGAGNWFLNGERSLEKDWDVAMPELRRVFQGGDVVVHVCGLGGGTGNGSVPLIMHKLRAEKIPAEGVYHFAVGVWPYPDESKHRQINAIMGLSRLLRFGTNGKSNADFVLLLGNKELATLAKTQGIGSGLRFTDLNQVAVRILDALISAGQEAQAVIDAKDYAINRQRYHFQHFTAGVAWNVPSFMNLDEAIGEAFANTMMGVDGKTAISAYLIVQAPASEINDPAFSVGEVQRGFRQWCDANGVHFEQRMETVVPDPTLQGSYHVILFLGGFDLNPLVRPYKSHVENHVKVLGRDEEGKEQAETLSLLWERLEKYVEESDETRRLFKG